MCTSQRQVFIHMSSTARTWQAYRDLRRTVLPSQLRRKRKCGPGNDPSVLFLIEGKCLERRGAEGWGRKVFKGGLMEESEETGYSPNHSKNAALPAVCCLSTWGPSPTCPLCLIRPCFYVLVFPGYAWDFKYGTPKELRVCYYFRLGENCFLMITF